MASLPQKHDLLSGFQAMRSDFPDAMLNWDDNFTDLRECSCEFQQAFMYAWETIERGSIERLQESILHMKNCAGACPGPDRYLDVCCIQSMVSKVKGGSTLYYMTLLARATVFNQHGMAKMLIENGAHPWMGNGLTGNPLTQALVYCLHNSCPEKADLFITQDLTKKADKKSEVLNIDIVYYMYRKERSHTIKIIMESCSMIELAIDIQRMDIAKVLVKGGTNAIYIGRNPNEVSGVVQLFSEYYSLGTNDYISWLLHEHLSYSEVPEFIDEVMKVEIFNDVAMDMFDDVGRHPAHALLTCNHEIMSKKFLEKHGYKYLTISDATGKTALQISAERGDLGSVKVIFSLMKKYDTDDITKALFFAARGGYLGIVEFIFERSISQSRRDDNFSLEWGKVFQQAIDERLPNIFEALRNYEQELILEIELDDDQNTLGHKAASIGNSALFKVIFPLMTISDNVTYPKGMCQLNQMLRQISNEQNVRVEVFSALVSRNSENKTPLHIAIENNCLCILKTLDERIIERESNPSAEQNMEKNAWESFWMLLGPELLIYACSCGSVDSVKLLVKMKCLQHYGSFSVNGQNPLLCAAEHGKDETVQYLLDLDNQFLECSKDQALLLAAENGHSRCVRILLKKKANVNLQGNRSYNSLMKAIEHKHRETVLIIVSDGKQGLEALRFNNKAPFRMLIELMPDVAEWVLNECVQAEEEELGQEFTDDPSIQSDGGSDKKQGDWCHLMSSKFELIEDDIHLSVQGIKCEQESPNSIEMIVQSDGIAQVDGKGQQRPITTQASDCESLIHPLKLMVKFENEKLLKHPLVKEFVTYKWWRIGLPGLLLYIFCYLLFLLTLTVFALLLPNPRSNCNGRLSSSLDSANLSSNNTDAPSNTCGETGQDGAISDFLYFAAVFVIILVLLNLAIEGIQFVRRRKLYLKEFENYLQIFTFVSCIVFVLPIGNSGCWCLPPWKWQIGVVALFLAWFNGIILLKDMPFLGEPVTMLLNVYYNFIKLIYLPILLILTFGFPSYMLFVRELVKEENNSSTVITSFATAYIAPVKVLVQTAGELDFETIFNHSPLLYPVLSYILFILFIIAMPILFNNFLIGMAVGETEEERRKASLTRIITKVNYIFEVEEAIYPFVKWLLRGRCLFLKRKGRKQLDNEVLKKLREDNNEITREIESRNRIEDMRQKVDGLFQQVSLTNEGLSSIRTDTTQQEKDIKELKKVLTTVQGDIAKYQRDLKEEMAAMTETILSSVRDALAVTRK